MKIKLSKTNRNTLFKLTLYIGLAMAVYAVSGVIILIIAQQIYHSFAFQGTDLIYRLSQLLQNNFLLFVFIYMLVGYVTITLYFMRKPFLYIEEVRLAAKNLYASHNTDLQLSPILRDIELDFTDIKLKTIANEHAAREAEQRKNDLIVYLAHDLKTPLTSVIGYLSLLRDEQEISPELRQKYLSISLDKAERLEDLINEFFEITRFNLTNLTIEPCCINLSLMLEQLEYEFKPMLNEKGLTCSLCVPANVYIICDANKLQRVFDNLFRNAINYSFQDSPIEIRVEMAEHEIFITFKNCGNTIPPEKLERIFEQFFRLDTSRATKSGGAGLGLAIAKEIVELHHGTLKAYSSDETITFKIMLPLNH